MFRDEHFQSRESLADDFVISEGEAQHRVSIGAAVGVAAWKHGDTSSEVLHRADFAMYEKRNSGLNRMESLKLAVQGPQVQTTLSKANRTIKEVFVPRLFRRCDTHP